MSAPFPLPITLPIGTKISYTEDYTSLSTGILMRGLFGFYYYFDSVYNNTINKELKDVSVAVDTILWDELSKTNVCKWCKEKIYEKESICSSNEKLCYIYWKTLLERMALDYKLPEDALEYDRISVKNFVDFNRKNNKNV